MSPMTPRPALPTLRHMRLLWVAAAAAVIAAVTGAPDGPAPAQAQAQVTSAGAPGPATH